MLAAPVGNRRLVIVCTVCDLPLKRTSVPGVVTAREFEPAIGPATLRYQAPGSSVSSNSTRPVSSPRTVATEAAINDVRTKSEPTTFLCINSLLHTLTRTSQQR